MSLRIRYSTVGQTVTSGLQFWGSFSRDLGYAGYSGGYMSYYFDPMCLLLREHRWCLPCEPHNVGSLMGFKDLDLYDSFLDVSHKPRPFDSSDLYDSRLYGSLYQNLRMFGDVLSGRNPWAPTPVGEHATRHASFSGELIAQQVPLPTKRISNLFLDQTSYELRDWFGDYIVSGTVTSTFPLVVELALSHSDWAMYDFLELLSALEKTPGGFWSVIDGVYRVGEISDVTYVDDPNFTLVEYHVSAYENNSYYGLQRDAEWDSQLIIRKDLMKGSVVPYVGLSASTVSARDPIYLDILNYHGDWAVGNLSLSGDFAESGSMMRPRGIILSAPATPSTFLQEPKTANVIYTDLSHSRFLCVFEEQVGRDWYDITPSSLFSTVDAFKQAEGSLNTNVLQNLAKLPKIVDTFPQVAEGVKILGKIAKRDLSLLTLKQILDLATSTTLQANFEWRPYVALFNDYFPALLSTFRDLGNIQGHVIGHGSFMYKMVNQLGRKDVTLRTRTKLVMDASASALLSAALGLDAVGLIPKASNIWDLLPFSFVANWFTGVGSALRRAEYSLLLATIPAYYVHTYALTSPLSEDELRALKAYSSSKEPASLRLYYRDVSLCTPYPRDSKFGFGIPSEMPSLGTLGSLLYQLILG